ncbi:odorant receptor Or1 [Tribolium castaneum]|uniref:Odorant receptor n=1 Tax=Tribolium castaneum TaxID=7070 RepID=C0Z3Q5_TRICA|nr:PREDICTED: odorant receptor Or1 [Tribolium castaneum]CAM84006.1 olfactory receptor 8 [Tribolium castaneum]|eukprot:XP_015839074.1 PREDICTED: odorant receptor Or1 [Tribolium castaneum]
MGFMIQDYDLRNAFSLERKLMLVVGFYPKRDNKHEILYWLSAFFNLLISYGQLTTMIIQMVFDRSDLSKLTESLLYFFTHFTFLCKLLNFQYYSKDLIEIENFLTDPIFYGYSFEQLDIIKAKIRSCAFISNAFRICCTFTCSFYCLVPFIDESRKKILPLPGWFPYDTTNYYYSTFFVQSLSLFISAYCNTAIDILTWKLITLASAQFEILKENLTKIDYEGGFNETKGALVRCITHHAKIVNYTERVEAIFSKGIFLQLFGSVIVICTTGFQLIVVPIPSVQFAVLGTYLCGMTTQVATYCYYGHEVMTTSDAIGMSLYLSNWYASHVKIRKIVMIFLEKTKKPTIVKAGNFITLSLATLTQILRSAYSYFAVLQRLYKDS